MYNWVMASIDGSVMGRRRYILDAATIGRRRIERGLSMCDLERATGLCHSTIIKACKTGDVGLRSMRLLCQALDLELRDTLVDARTGRPWSAVERGPM